MSRRLCYDYSRFARDTSARWSTSWQLLIDRWRRLRRKLGGDATYDRERDVDTLMPSGKISMLDLTSVVRDVVFSICLRMT